MLSQATDYQGLPWWLIGKEPACHCLQCRRCRFDPWVRKIPWRRKWQPTPVFLPGEFHGQWGLTGYSPWGYKESDTTEWLTHTQPLAKENYNYHILIKKWRVAVCMSYTTWKSKRLFHFLPSPTFIRDLCAVTSWFGKEILTMSLSWGGREVSPFLQPHCFHA